MNYAIQKQIFAVYGQTFYGFLKIECSVQMRFKWNFKSQIFDALGIRYMPKRREKKLH